MSNDMTILSNQNLPAHLRQADTSNSGEFAAGVSQGQLLPVLSIRGKEFRLRFQGQERSISDSRSLDVVMVRARPHVSKRYFAQQYEGGSVEAPSCASTDGVRPDSGDDKQCDTCAMCPHNQFGSRITPSGKQGKACSDYKRLVVIPLVNGQPLAHPCLLDVPATSLKSPKGHKGEELFLREYMGMLERHNVPVQGVITKLSFTSAEFPQLSFSVSDYTSEALYNTALALRKEDVVVEALSEALTEVPGTQIEHTADPLPAERPAHLQAAQEAKQEAKPEPEPEPKQEAKPEASDDLMGEINDLLGGL